MRISFSLDKSIKGRVDEADLRTSVEIFERLEQFDPTVTLASLRSIRVEAEHIAGAPPQTIEQGWGRTTLTREAKHVHMAYDVFERICMDDRGAFLKVRLYDDPIPSAPACGLPAAAVS